MAKSTRTKTPAANIAVPQSKDEAAAYLKLIGEQNRAVARLEADMNDKIAAIKEAFEAKAAPYGEATANLTEGLRIWCEANRQALTGGKVKFADLGTGKVEWRMSPPKVTLKDVDAVIDKLRELGLTKFLRTKTEINKDAMLEDKVNARLVKGVSIGSEGEQFIVEPFEVKLEGGAQ